MQVIGFDLDWTLSYYPLSTAEVLREALSCCCLPSTLMGDLDQAAERYNDRWLQMERTMPDLNTLRRRILESLLAETETADPSVAVRLADAYEAVRQVSGVLSYPGVDQLLADLGAHYPLGLLTNGPSQMQWDKIRTLHLADIFDVIIVAGDVAIYKPDRRVFMQLTSRLIVRGYDTLFARDSYDCDIVDATRAGMHTAWIASHEIPVPGEVYPTLRCASTAELQEVLL